MQQLAPNTIVDRYVVERSLGTGGMATVYLVRHRRLGTAHALKLLHLPTARIRERLMNEGRIQGGLHHPNVVNVTDVVDWRGAPGLIMEFVDGPALDGFLVANRLSVEQADSLARGLIAGVGAAHKQGLVHRDLKPGNILLRQMEDEIIPKITDFGLVKLRDSGGGGIGLSQTRSGIAMGTPAYMSPEQIRDAASVDHRADIFSLGAILYELVTGQKAFDGDDMIDIWDKIRDGEYTPPEDLVADLPDRMARAIKGTLTTDRDARTADCQTLLQIWTGGDMTPLQLGIWDEPALDQVRALSPTSLAPPEATTGSVSSETYEYMSGARPIGILDLSNDATIGEQLGLTGPGANRSRGWVIGGVTLLLATVAGGLAWWDYDRVKVAHYAHVEPQISKIKLWKQLSDEEIASFPSHYRVETRRGLVRRVQQLNSHNNPAVGDEFDSLLYGNETMTDGSELHILYDEADRVTVVEIYDQVGVKRGEHQVEWIDAHTATFRSVDAHGRLGTTNGGGYTQEWTMDDLGNAVEGRSLDASGNPVASKVDGSSGVRATVDELGRQLTEELLDQDGKAMRDRDGAIVRKQDFEDPDHEWLPTRVRAMGFGGAPAMALDGCAELRFEYTNGVPVSQSCWAAYDEPALSTGGCHIIRQQHTPERRLLQCVGIDGEPAISMLNVSQIETLYDDNGYPSEYRTLDGDGELATIRQGYASWKAVYDDRGVQLQQGPLYGANGQPEVDALSRAAVTRGTYKDGVLIELTYHDEAERLTMTRFGFAIRRYEIDGGLPVGWRLFDQDGEPTTSIWGYHRMVHTEVNGLVTSTRMFAIDGEAVVGRWSRDWPFALEELGSQFIAGVHGVHHEYDDAGRETRQWFTNTAGELVVNRELGYATRTHAYDERGNLIEQNFFATDGAPMLGPQQFATLRLRYNDRGIMTETAVFGIDGAPSLGIRGYHRMKAKVNAAGMTEEQRYLDAAGLPVTRIDEGCAVLKMGWKRRDQVWGKCFGPDGEPARVIPHGVHEVIWERDATGRETALVAKGGLGRPDRHWGGFHRREYDYDKHGNITETRYFDAQGEPANNREGFAKLVQTWDGSGNLIAESTFHPDGNPVSPRGRPGFQIERAYDALGRVLSERVLDVDSQPVGGLAQTFFAYDALGNEIERRFALGDGAPADEALGYSRIGMTYDEYGQPLRLAWFDADNQPVSNEEGCTVQVIRYDEVGVEVDTRCIGGEGRE